MTRSTCGTPTASSYIQSHVCVVCSTVEVVVAQSSFLCVITVQLQKVPRAARRPPQPPQQPHPKDLLSAARQPLSNTSSSSLEKNKLRLFFYCVVVITLGMLSQFKERPFYHRRQHTTQEVLEPKDHHSGLSSFDNQRKEFISSSSSFIFSSRVSDFRFKNTVDM